MKFITLLALSLFALIAHADPRVDAIVRNCERIHSAKMPVCRVVLDRRDFNTPTIIFPGIGEVDTNAYVEMKNAGDQMCAWARRACSSASGGSFDSKKCLAARASWRSY